MDFVHEGTPPPITISGFVRMDQTYFPGGKIVQEGVGGVSGRRGHFLAASWSFLRPLLHNSIFFGTNTIFAEILKQHDTHYFRRFACKPG